MKHARRAVFAVCLRHGYSVLAGAKFCRPVFSSVDLGRRSGTVHGGP